MSENTLELALRRQELTKQEGYNLWETVTKQVEVPISDTALLICDAWDRHWCRGARERLDRMLGRMNDVVGSCRDRGMQIIHSPSGTMAFYTDHPARERMAEYPSAGPPENLEHDDPPLPVDASDDGSDTEEDEPAQVWTRQHPAIEIDQSLDIISDNGEEIYSLFQHKGVDKLLIMGVHTNMCVLHRSFGIKQMIRWGIHVALIRDLTDTMYNPAMPPYVSHEEGTRLVIQFIEKFWCPTIGSEDLL
ncbi:uncharacterized protein METZ01_LOCUS242497 [marine metagenome]|uniref:Isochorismatase-like domain-containing protein n=1 Tax=marine metagenome TaxID=408172 RepID=A0A382HSN6_9ZZZZ